MHTDHISLSSVVQYAPQLELLYQLDAARVQRCVRANAHVRVKLAIFSMATTSHFTKSTDGACSSPSSTISHKALIGVMGVTGSGKSSLITDVVGCDNIVGHHLESGMPW